MSKRVCLCAAAVAILGARQFAWGGSGDVLAAEADAVVVGSVASFTITWPDAFFSITVEQSLKGGVPPGAVLSVKIQSPYARDVGTMVDTHPHHGIWFLRREGESAWRSLSARGPTGPLLYSAYFPVPAVMPERPEFQAGPEETVSDSIARLVAATMETGTGNSLDVLSAAGSTSSPAVMRIFRYFAGSSDQAKRSVGLAGLILRQDKQALLDFLGGFGRFTPRQTEMIIGWGLTQFASADVAAIKAFGKVLEDPNAPAPLRAAAADCLRAVHTRETLPYLARLLDSKDPRRQVDGVFGLSAFANGLGIPRGDAVPSMSWLNFRKPTKYSTPETEQHILLTVNADDIIREEIVTFWKRWWKEHERELSGEGQ